MRRSNILIAAVFTLTSVIGYTQGPSALANTVKNLQFRTINVDGMKRSYYIHMPSAHRTHTKLPLVLVLHGGGKGDGLTVAKYLGFTSLADNMGFVVAYPNGVGAYWRDGREHTHRRSSNNSIDDIKFISKLIDHLTRKNIADPKRIYVAGISNGGMMTLRLGCELSPKLAAIAPIAANIPMNIIGSCNPDLPLPILLMNGTDDPIVPYYGGHVHIFRKRLGKVVSTAETVSFWVRHNRSNVVPHDRELPDRDPYDYSTVDVTTYSNPNNGAEVVLYTIQGGGHTLPGSDIPNRPWIVGEKNNDINGARVILKFFNKHSR